MGEQIHIGGMRSSLDLAERGGIRAGTRGIDLCCASGAGMRFLVRFRDVAHMTGVDATRAMLDLGRQRTASEGLAERISFVEADACRTGLPSAQADFVWGEDAWCYVEDKRGLIAEAARLVKPGGTILFTDWMEGPMGLDDAQAERYLRLMRFPNVLKTGEYAALLEASGCGVRVAADTGRFADQVKFYIDYVERQLMYDALKILGFDLAAADGLLAELRFIEALAREGRVFQGMVVAEKVR
jgi:SAM-dependent methyltransferase